MPWTTYHDWLIQEAVALMTEPEWYNQATITTRLTDIRDELESAGSTINTTDTEIQQLIEDFDEARLSANTANEARYDQLVEAATGAEDPLSPMSFPQVAKYMSDTHWDVLVTAYEGLENAQETRDETLETHWTDAATTLDTAWDDAWTALDARFDVIGERARLDIRDTFDSQKSTIQQSMVDRGIYNATVLDSMKNGNATEESAELRRWDEQIGMQQINVYHDILSKQTGMQFESLSAEAQAIAQKVANQMNLSLVELSQRAKFAVDLQRVYEGTLEAIQARTDVAPSLSDIATLTMQLGRGAASTLPMAGLSPLMFFQSTTGSGISGLLEDNS